MVDRTSLTLLDFVLGLLGLPFYGRPAWTLLAFMRPELERGRGTAAEVRALELSPETWRAMAYELTRHLFASSSHGRSAWDGQVELFAIHARRPFIPFALLHDADTWAAIAIGLATYAEELTDVRAAAARALWPYAPPDPEPEPEPEGGWPPDLCERCHKRSRFEQVGPRWLCGECARPPRLVTVAARCLVGPNEPAARDLAIAIVTEGDPTAARLFWAGANAGKGAR